MRALLKTEDNNFQVTEFSKDEHWLFCLGTLFRILEDNEQNDRAPDALLITEKETLRLIVVSGKFKSAKRAFAAMKQNTKNLQEAMAMIEKIPDKPKELDKSSGILYFGYSYNYFGGDIFKNHIIDGASLSIAFRPIKDGKIVKLTDEPEVTINTPSNISSHPQKFDYFLSNMIDVKFDRDYLATIKVNKEIKELFLKDFGWDDILIEIYEYELYYKESEWTSAPISVSKEEWEQFIRNHIDDFDIIDNIFAQCISYGWVTA